MNYCSSPHLNSETTLYAKFQDAHFSKGRKGLFPDVILGAGGSL
jgi:hypothetical protein